MYTLSCPHVAHCRRSVKHERCLFYFTDTLVCNSQLSLWVLLEAVCKIAKRVYKLRHVSDRLSFCTGQFD